MKDFKTLLATRRSHRLFDKREIDADDVQLLLRAALMSPSSMNRQAWHFVVVDDKMDLLKLSDAKENGSSFVKDAPLAIVVLGDPVKNDCWVEDGCIAASSIQWQAEDLGLGSCWVQIRGRGLSDGTTSESVVRGILGIPDSLSVLCIIAIGHKANDKPMHSDVQLKWENVHIGHFED